MGILTSTPVLLVGLWLATALVLRVLLLVRRRQQEHERYLAAHDDGSRAALIGATEVRVGTVVGAVASVLLALVVSWALLSSGPDESELDEIVDGVAFSYRQENVDDRPRPTVDDVVDRVEEEGGDRGDVVVREMAPGWQETGGEYGQTVDGVRFQVTTTDGELARCLEVTWSQSDVGDGGFSVAGRVAGDLC